MKTGTKEKINKTISSPENGRDVTREVEKYQERLKNFIRRRIGSAEDAKDILQEVFFQLARADFLTKPIEQLEAWLYAVTRNKITDWKKRKKSLPVPEFCDDDDDAAFTDEISNVLFEDAVTPEDEYLRLLVWQELEKALADMPAEQRKIFEMTELEGMSFKEIAKKTGTPVNTLISRKRYAVLFLRERLRFLYLEIIEY